MDEQTHYLASKRTVDDRALNRRVLESLEPRLAEATVVLELGAGIGTMVQRLLEWSLLPGSVTYTLVDIDGESLETAVHRLEAWADSREIQTKQEENGLQLEHPTGTCTVRTREVDVRGGIEPLLSPQPDVIIGSAFIDLFRPTEVAQLFAPIPDGTTGYFPITFDGGTIFEPVWDRVLEDHLMDRYHEDMRTREPPGDPHAGRHLLARASTDHTLVAAGSADWVVTPTANEYPAAEAAFLTHIVDTVGSALESDPEVDQDALTAWVDRRHAQIERGELVYVAHQFDVLLEF